MSNACGCVYLVGAGPGDPSLITVRGLALLKSADVVVYDRLIGSELLSCVRPDAELIDAGKSPGRHRLSQDEINALLIEQARRGRLVVRLKGGDPFVFGRGHEELFSCRQAGVDCVVVPGVTSAIAGPAAAGIPVTRRGVANSFAVVTAESALDGSPDLDYSALAHVDTLVVLMGRANLRQVADALIRAGRDPHTAVACVERATTPQQRVETATLSTIAEAVDRARLTNPMITVIGDVVELAALMSDANLNCGLHRRRIVITRPKSAPGDVERLIFAAGGCPIAMPLIRIEYDRPAELDEALSGLDRHAWLVFTSLHGVRAFGRALQRAGTDARALGACRVAAVGGATAEALKKIGILPDLVPSRSAAAELAAAMAGSTAPGSRVLFPRGDLGGTEMVQALVKMRCIVRDPVVYRTRSADPHPAAVEEIRRGVDAILFFSPSAVRRFCELQLDSGEAAIACIGPTTAAEAAALGMKVNLVSEAPSAASMIAALERHFSAIGAHRL